MDKLLRYKLVKLLCRFRFSKGININQVEGLLFPESPLNLTTNVKIRNILSVPSDEFVLKQDVFTLRSAFKKSFKYKTIMNALYNANYTFSLFEDYSQKTIIQVYQIVVDFQQVNYNFICTQLEQITGTVIESKQAAHYCKELKRFRLVSSQASSENNEKLISPQIVQFNNETLDIDQTPLSIQSDSSFKDKINLTPSEEAIIKENDPNNQLSKHYLDCRFSHITNKYDVKENILNCLKAQKEGLTVNKLTLLLGMFGREKSVSRCLNLLEIEGLIVKTSIRVGRVFEYYYKLKHSVSSQSNSLLPLCDFYLSFIIDKINQEPKFHAVKQHFSQTLRKSMANIKNQERVELFAEYINKELEKQGSKCFSNISFDRYVFCLNKIAEEKCLLLSELQKNIGQELESDKDYTIDRKTFKNILENLEKLGFVALSEYEMILRNLSYKYTRDREELNQKKVIIRRFDIVEEEAIFIEKLDQMKKQITNPHTYHKEEEENESQPEFNRETDLRINRTEKNCLKLCKILLKHKKILQTKAKQQVFNRLLNWANLKMNLQFYFLDKTEQRDKYLYKEIEESLEFPSESRKEGEKGSEVKEIFDSLVNEASSVEISKEDEKTTAEVLGLKRQRTTKRARMEDKDKARMFEVMSRGAKANKHRKINSLLDILPLLSRMHFCKSLSAQKVSSSSMIGEYASMFFYLEKMGLIRFIKHNKENKPVEPWNLEIELAEDIYRFIEVLDN